MRVLILGASGMLGHMAFRLLSETDDWDVYATVRSADARRHFTPELQSRLVVGVEAASLDSLTRVMTEIRPALVINCIGVVKQLAAANDPLVCIPLNSLLPHRLARICALGNSRLIHISTDCVFNGRRGNYVEADPPDAEDLYGRSKLLGEVDYPNAITLRTSIIGPELGSRTGLVEWFLGEQGRVRGFTRAIFSGLTTRELTQVIRDRVVPHPELHGIYHVSSDAMDKFHLLKLIKEVYGLDTTIDPDDAVAIDRSLDSSRFRAATGYHPPDWRSMIADMRGV